MERPKHVVILAGTHGEAWRYAKAVGLRSYRIATRPTSVRNTKVADIHELPSFEQRRDRHAILAELKWTKGKRLKVTMPCSPPPAPVDQGDGFGEQLTIDDALRQAEELGSEAMRHVVHHADEDALTEAFNHALVQHAAEELESLEQNVAELTNLEETSGSTTGETEQGEDAAPTEEPQRRTRRRRCAECGELVPPNEEHTHDAPAPTPSFPEFF